MNGTCWETLTGFVKHLGKAGKCVVDETEKGWFVTWIDRDPETIARQELLAKKNKMVKDDEEKLRDFIAKQVEIAKEKEGDKEEKEVVEFKRENEEEKITLKMKNGFSDTASVASSTMSSKSFKQTVMESLGGGGGGGKFLKPADKVGEKRKKSALEEIIEEEERKKKMAKEKEKSSAPVSSKKDSSIKDYWLKKDIVVKIVTKSLGEKYYKQKGYVKEVVDKYAAVVVLLETKAKIKLDQQHLETVIPKEGRDVLIVNGQYRGEEATLNRIDVDNFCANLTLKTGEKVKLPYEHFSKLHQP